MSELAIWLIYSREHNAWWRPKAAGYTSDVAQAGRYTKADAYAHSRIRDTLHDGSAPEVPVIAPEAEEIMADLLAALKQMVADFGDSAGDDMEAKQVIRDAQDAIAKAEGRS